MRYLAVLSLIVLTVACATVGTRIDASLVDQLVIGTSTKAEAISLLGKPSTVTVNSTVTVLAWSYAHATVFTGAKSTAVVLTFNKEGILTDKTQTQMDMH